MEHCIDRTDDVLSGSRCKHSGTSGSASEMWKQNSDQNKDWSQLQDAFKVSACCVLHTQRTGRTWNAFNGTCFNSTGRMSKVTCIFMTTDLSTSFSIIISNWNIKSVADHQTWNCSETEHLRILRWGWIVVVHHVSVWVSWFRLYVRTQFSACENIFHSQLCF